MKEINRLLNSEMDFIISVKKNDLIDLGKFLIDETSKKVKDKIKSGEEDVLLNVNEVMQKFKIKNRSTVWRWQKKGLLNPIPVGKLNLYKSTEVEYLMNTKLCKQIN